MARLFCPKRVGSLFILLLLSTALGLAVTGCGQKESRVLTGIRFDRSHGSAWGNQFYIHVNPEEIVLVRWFPENTGEQQTREHIPITAEQWAELSAAVRALELKEDRPSFWQGLWKNRPLDGTEVRTLTLIWDGEEEIRYRWPADPRAEELETLLEQLTVS